MHLYHLGLSGGKDSSGLLLFAVHESNLPREALRVTFCDTGNEDKLTYEHLDLLRNKVIIPAGITGGLEVLRAERTFFELALHKHRFPARKAQFCTHYLKLYPTQDWLKRQWDLGHEVTMMNGKRTAESEQRKRLMQDKPARAFSDFWGCEEWAPLKDWTIEDIAAIHNRYGIPLNPLYALGAHRVGCWPCINCGKTEIRLVAKHRPEKIKQIAEWEARITANSKHPATFFHFKTATMPFRTLKFVGDDGIVTPVAPIEKIVEWAHTERGGKQQRLDLDEPKACWMNYGACE